MWFSILVLRAWTPTSLLQQHFSSLHQTIVWPRRRWRCFAEAAEDSSSPRVCGCFCHCHRHRWVSLGPPTACSTWSASIRTAPSPPSKPTTTAASSPSSPASTSPSEAPAAPTPSGQSLTTDFFLQFLDHSVVSDHLLNWFILFIGFITLKLGLELLRRITICRWTLAVTLCGWIAFSAKNAPPEATLVYASHLFSLSYPYYLHYLPNVLA